MRPISSPISIVGSALATAAVFLTLCSSAGAATPIALGINIDNAPGDAAALQTYTGLAGRNPAIVMWYQSWSEPLFYSTQLPNTEAVGAIPSITWQPQINGAAIPLSQIVAGQYDSYIKASADQAAAWKLPIYIRFAPEMNIASSLYGPSHSGNTPATFVAAWRHIVSIFQRQNATNVEWIWSPNTDCSGACPFAAYYPGDSWVDWVALDGYNYSSVDDMPWRSFDQVFATSYAELTALTSKPMMIGETSSAEQGGNKAQWITQAFAGLPQKYPDIRAVVWFDRVKETDWRVNSSPTGLAAWQSVVKSAADEGTPTDLLASSPTRADVDTPSAIAPTSTSSTTATSNPASTNPIATPTATPKSSAIPEATPGVLVAGTTPLTSLGSTGAPRTAPVTKASGATSTKVNRAKKSKKKPRRRARPRAIKPKAKARRRPPAKAGRRRER